MWRTKAEARIDATAGNKLSQTIFLMEGKIILCGPYAAHDSVFTHKYLYYINEDIMMNGIESTS